MRIRNIRLTVYKCDHLFFLILQACCVKYVCGRVQCCLTGILDHAYDETDTNYLHGNIIGDSEKAAGHRDQKKRTAGNSGSTSRTCSSQDAEDQSGREVYADTKCMQQPEP